MQFDRNNLIGLVLLGVLMVVYLSITNKNRQALLEAEQAAADSIALVEAQQEAAREEALRQEQADLAELLSNGVDSNSQSTASLLEGIRENRAEERRERIYGSFAPQASGTESSHVIEDDYLRITLSNKGGRITQVELKQHNDLYGNLVSLITPENYAQSWSFFYEGNRRLHTDSLYTTVIPGDDGKSITFRIDAGNDRWMDQTYRLTDTAYFVDYDLVFHRFDEVIPTGQPNMTLDWNLDLRRQEKNKKYEAQMSKAYYRYSTGDTDSKIRNGDVDFDGKVEWLAYVDQFFHAALISDYNFTRNGVLEVDKFDDDTVYLKSFESTLYLDAPRESQVTRNLHFSFSPNDFRALKKLDRELERVVPVGGIGIGWVNKAIIIPIFQWLNGSIANYGLIILILTMMIKVALTPLTYRSYLSMAKMKLLQPELNELKEKYGDDQQRMGQEQMKLYSQTGVSPLGGCLPMVLQMPILFAMYRFFPNSIELRQESFLWADDLSSYDVLFRIPEIPIIGDHISGFTLLAGVTSLLYARMNASMTPQTGGPAQYMQYFFPVMMIFIFNNFSSALTYYYLLQNIISFGQQWVLKTFFIDNDKLHAQIQDKRKNPQKKSGFAKRIEAYTKTLQANQEALKKERRQQHQANRKNKGGKKKR